MPTTQSQQSEYVRAPELARFFGCSVRHVYNLLSKGDLPSYKMGRNRIFRIKECEATLVRTSGGARHAGEVVSA